MAVCVLAATILMQLAAVGLALRQIRPSGARAAWLLIASAIGLTLVPRIVTFIGALAFLPKPFTADSLLRAVRESIDGD